MNTPLTVKRHDEIEPFWQRIGSFFTYPVQTSPLLTIIVLAVCRLCQYAGFLGVWLNLLVSVALYKFAAEVLWRTANGRFDPPEGYSTDDELGWLQAKVQAVLVIVTVLGYLILGPELGILASLFIAFGMPGASMSAAIEQNLWKAVNPATWIAIAMRLGWPYLVLAGLCAAFFTTQATTQALIAPYFPGPFGVIVFYLIAHYFTVATFNLMGYMIYQYHEQLGFEIEDRPAPLHGADLDGSLLAEAEALAADGQTQAAEELLRDHIRERGASHAVHARYRKLLALRGDKDALVRHAQEYLNILMANKDERKAVDLVREVQEIDPGFKPTVAEYVAPIAERASTMGMNQVAIKLLSGFHRAFPKNKDIPRNYLLAAKILAEKMNKEKEATALLTQVQAQFPQHPLLPDIETYLKFLASLSSANKPGAT